MNQFRSEIFLFLAKIIINREIPARGVMIIFCTHPGGGNAGGGRGGAFSQRGERGLRRRRGPEFAGGLRHLGHGRRRRAANVEGGGAQRRRRAAQEVAAGGGARRAVGRRRHVEVVHVLRGATVRRERPDLRRRTSVTLRQFTCVYLYLIPCYVLFPLV